jgi:membrane protein DedA with SNARE-associated domain
MTLASIAIYVLVAALVFANGALGFVLPGNAAGVIGGVASTTGQVRLLPVVAVVIGAAIVGDSTAYATGRRLARTPRYDSEPGLRERQIETETVFRGPGGVLYRCTPALRRHMPILTGATSASYGQFLRLTALGCLAWGSIVVLAGWLAGIAYTAVARADGRTPAMVNAGIAALAVLSWLFERWCARRDRTTAAPPYRESNRQ